MHDAPCITFFIFKLDHASTRNALYIIFFYFLTVSRLAVNQGEDNLA